MVIEYPWLARLASFSAGALQVLSFAPFGYFPLALFLLSPILLAFFFVKPRTAAHLGFAYGAGLFLTGTYWLYISIHVFGNAPLFLAVFLMLCLVVIMGFYYAAVGWLVSRLSAGNVLWFFAVAPAVWVSIEWLRGWFLSGFPWMTFGYSQIDSPLAGFSPVLGVLGVSLMLLVSASALVTSIFSSGSRRAGFALLAITPWIGGAALKQVDWTEPSGPPVRTTIVQGGVSQDRKWLAEQFAPTLELYRSSVLNNSDSALIIWPEVAIPSVLDEVEGFVSRMEAHVAQQNTMLLFGILERDAEEGRIYNSVVAIDGIRRQIYRKRHLVPFGEFFPVPDFVREWMRLMNLPYSDISAGNDVQPLITTSDGNQLSVAICYEDAYAAEQLYALPDTTLLINVSNDAWFGNSIAPHQHLQIARMRAIEVGRSVVRSTNNGVSAFIGPRGELIATGPQFEYAAMSHNVIPRSGMTPYAATGNWPVISLSILILAVAGWRIRYFSIT